MINIIKVMPPSTPPTIAPIEIALANLNFKF